MTDWSSIAEITTESNVLTKLIYSLFGIYVWEIIGTLGFEWSLISRQRRFTWPLVPFFFLCRYCLLFALVGMIVSFEVTKPINCQALYTWISVTGNMAILCASTSLLLRTVALWNRQLKIAIPLGILCLAHWIILWRGMFIIDAQYSPEGRACVVTKTNHIFLNVSFFTTMGVDFIVLCFTIAALTRQSLRSGLWKLLFQDELVYFCITFMCNAAPAILNVLNLNTVMDIIATIPAATVSSLAACRLVMRLQDFSNNEVYVSNASSGAQGQAHFAAAMARRYTQRMPEIRVTTDQIVVQDFCTAPGNSKEAGFDSPNDDAEYDDEIKEVGSHKAVSITDTV